MEHLFVYGTLLKYFKHKVRQDIEANITFIANATAEGELYDLGNYPGFVEGEGEVKGELYSISDPKKVFAVLDEYEGLHEADPEYERKKLAVTPANGEAVVSWVYVYRLAHHQHKRIINGDYVAFIRDKVNNESNY